MSEGIRLDIGCGEKPRPGFVGVDAKISNGSVWPLKVPMPDGTLWEPPENSIEEIYASHVLEHLGHWEARKALRDWFKALKPGGRIRVAVPDMHVIMAGYVAGEPMNVGGYTWGGQQDDLDFHRTGFNEGLLTALLQHFGGENVKRWVADQADCARLPVSLNLEATKRPGPALDTLPITPLNNVRAIQSMPRLAFTDNMHSLSKLHQIGITQFTTVVGVNWGQCLERAMEECLEDGTEWILTCDYDSIFLNQHVVTLWNIIHEIGEKNAVDAIAPIEFKREENVVLAGIINDKGERMKEVTLADIEPSKVPVEWAHFGLTFIRVEALRNLKHPWFMEIPNAEGKWGDGRTDNDIYFWRHLRANGGKVFVAPHVAIGHAQLMIVWPDQQTRPIYQFAGDWRKRGMPEDARR